MGRGKRISLDDADNLLEELAEVEPVSRGYYASVSAFISEHHDEFHAALHRGVTHEQIADLMQGHNITVSPTTLRRYLPKKASHRSGMARESEESLELSDLPIERAVCVVVAAMSIIEVESWDTFTALCKFAGFEFDWSSKDGKQITELFFTRNGEVTRKKAGDTFIKLGSTAVTWKKIEPNKLSRSSWLYERLEEYYEELIPLVDRLAEEFESSLEDEG